MKPIIINWLKWFQHGIKVLLASTAAFLVIAIPHGIIKMAIGSGQQALQMLGALSLRLFILLSIAWFGYLFTKLYTATTWGHDATKDIK
jgi:hypothetical protein